MAQFDVHRNKGALRDSIPFVVVVQSAQFDHYRRRVVVPLVCQTLLPRDTPIVGTRMNPVFVIEGVRVVLHSLTMCRSSTVYQNHGTYGRGRLTQSGHRWRGTLGPQRQSTQSGSPSSRIHRLGAVIH